MPSVSGSRKLSAVSARLASGTGSLPGLRAATFSPVYRWPFLREHAARREESFSSSSRKATKPIRLGVYPCDSWNLSYILRALSPNTVTFRVRTLTYESRGDTIQATAGSKSGRHNSSVAFLVGRRKKEMRKIYVIFSGSASSTGIHVGPMAVPEVRGGWLGRRRLGLALRALPRLL